MLVALEVRDHLGEIEVRKDCSGSALNVQEGSLIHLGLSGHVPQEVLGGILLAGIDDRVGLVVGVDDLVVGDWEPWLAEERNPAVAWYLGSWAFSIAVHTESWDDAILAGVVDFEVSVLVEVGVEGLVALL